MKTLMGIDPGRTTGYCFAEINDLGETTLRPMQAVDDVDDMWRRIVQVAPDYIIIEDFEYRNRARSGLDLFPVQMIGVVRLYTLTIGKNAPVIQKAAQGKSYYTDTILKNGNMHVRGIPHAMDAMRHVLQWITFGAGFQFVSAERGKIKLAIDDSN